MNLLLFNIILVAYLLITFLFGYLGYRGTKNVKDFMLAGRDSHPYLMAISYGASFVSTSAIVGFGGVSAVYGMGILWLPFLNILLGILIAFIFFGKKTRSIGFNLNAHTFPELLGKRYDSRLIQRMGGAVIFIFMPLYAGVVLIGIARFVETSLNIDYNLALLVLSVIIAVYVITGGLKGVIYNDAFQGSIMVIGMLILVGITYSKLGGITGAHQSLTNMISQVPQNLVDAGHQGWTAMPAMGSAQWWTLVSTIILGVGIGVLAQPQLAVRFMTVKSNKQLNRAILIGGIFVFLTTTIPYVCGALSNVYFFDTLGKISIDVAGGNIDKIIPAYISSAMPQWFVYIFLLTLLAASMSTISTQFHTIGTSFSRDIFRRYSYKKEEENKDNGRRGLLFSKIGVIVGIIVSVILGYYFPPSIIARGTALFFGICAATFLPAYIFALFWKGATKPGAISGMFTGLFASLFWMLFVHSSESARIGLSNLLFHKDSLLAFPWTVIDPILIAFPLSLLVTWIVSLCTKPLPEELLNRTFKK